MSKRLNKYSSRITQPPSQGASQAMLHATALIGPGRRCSSLIGNEPTTLLAPCPTRARVSGATAQIVHGFPSVVNQKFVAFQQGEKRSGARRASAGLAVAHSSSLNNADGRLSPCPKGAPQSVTAALQRLEIGRLLLRRCALQGRIWAALKPQNKVKRGTRDRVGSGVSWNDVSAAGYGLPGKRQLRPWRCSVRDWSRWKVGRRGS